MILFSNVYGMKHFFNTTRNENILESISKKENTKPRMVSKNIEDIKIFIALEYSSLDDYFLLFSSIDDYYKILNEYENIRNKEIIIHIGIFENNVISSNNEVNLIDIINKFVENDESLIDDGVLNYYMNYYHNIISNVNPHHNINFNELYYDILFFIHKFILYSPYTITGDSLRFYLYAPYYNILNNVIQLENIIRIEDSSAYEKLKNKPIKIKNFKCIDVTNNKSEETSSQNNSTKIINSITIPSHISRTLKEIKNDVKMIKSML